MKIAVLGCVLLFFVSFIACTKNTQEPNTPPSTSTDVSVTGRLQQKWQLISITQLEIDGPGRFQYIATPMDYMLFTSDSIFTFVEGTQANVKYQLLSDSSTLVFTENPAPANDTLHITSLTNHLLVFQGLTDSGGIGIDSLKR
jgi:hypothetical protein